MTSPTQASCATFTSSHTSQIAGALNFLGALCVQAQLIEDALNLGFDGLRTNSREHMRKVPQASEPMSAYA